MKKLVFLLVCLSSVFGVLRPTPDDFIACYEKNKASMMVYEGLPAFVLDENHLAVLKLPNQKLNSYIKYDPFLNLYLVRTDFSLIKPMFGDEESLNRNDWLGILDPKNPYIGHLKYLANNLNEKDRLNFSSKISLVASPCCKVMGIALSNNQFIGNRYLNHFKKYNEVYWGDIGVDFMQRGDKIYVSGVSANSRFWLNDEVLSLNGEKIENLRKLNEAILFSPIQTTLYFQVLRDNAEIEIPVNVFAKQFQEEVKITQKNITQKSIEAYAFGLEFNGLVISKIKKGSKGESSGFLVGDKVLKINDTLIKSKQDIMNVFSNQNVSEFEVLISRHASKFPYSNASGSVGYFDFFLYLKR